MGGVFLGVCAAIGFVVFVGGIHFYHVSCGLVTEMFMRRFRLWLVVAFLHVLTARATADEARPAPVAAVINTTLGSASGHIRQLAFDGNPNTYFASEQNPGTKDSFTLVFDRPVLLKSVQVTTGRSASAKGANTDDMLDAGTLELSADGNKFQPAAKFSGGAARSEPGRSIRAVRIRPAAEMKHPIAIREVTIISEPPVITFKFPVEIIVDVADAPEMKAWAEKVARICERAYPMINEELPSAGFKPPQLVRMSLKSSYKGVAMASRGNITGSVKYFKGHPDDVGAMVHETVHVVQRYRTRNNPGWLVEGIADYIRFFKYEPGKLGRINPDRARYDGSYRVSAAFLAHVTEKYDRGLVRKLNKAMREGEYDEAIWKALTKKTVQELGAEWRASLRRGPAAGAGLPMAEPATVNATINRGLAFLAIDPYGVGFEGLFTRISLE